MDEEQKNQKVCRKCGGPLDDLRRSYCNKCRPGPNWTPEDQRETRYEEEVKKTKRPPVLSNPLKGMSLTQVAALAREYGMTYGRFRGYVSAWERLPPKRKG